MTAGVASWISEVVTLPVRMPAFLATSMRFCSGLPATSTPIAPL